MGNINPLVNQLIVPENGSATNLGVQFGGGLLSSSGTGLFSDTSGAIAVCASGTEVFRYTSVISAMKMQTYSVGFADLNTAGTGVAALFGTALPIGTTVVRSFIKVTASFTGNGDSGSAIKLGIQDASVDVHASATLATYAAGLVEGVSTGSTANMKTIATTAKQLAVTWTIGGTDTALTAGAMTVYIQYI